LKEESETENKISLIEEHGLKGAMILVLSFLTPYIGNVLDGYIEDNLIMAVHREFIPITTELKTIKKEVAENRKALIKTVGSLVLSPSDIDYIARMAVAKQSIHKVKQIKSLLERNPQPTDGRYLFWEERMEKKIKNILVTNSQVYVRDLNHYQSVNVGFIGDYIWNEFPMNEFLDRVYEIALKSDVTDSGIIADDIMTYMLDIQNKFFNEMLIKMKEE